MECTGRPSIQEVEAGGSGVQSQPWLHRQFEVSMGYTRLCLKELKPFICLFMFLVFQDRVSLCSFGCSLDQAGLPQVS